MRDREREKKNEEYKQIKKKLLRLFGGFHLAIHIESLEL